MKINCIACGHNFDVDEAYDDYEGPVRCWVCGALLEIKTEEGSIRRMRHIGLTPPQTIAADDPTERVARPSSDVKRAPIRKGPVASGKGPAPTAAGG